MRGLYPFPQKDVEHRENWRAVSDVLDDLYMRPVLTPGDGALSAGALFVSNVVGNASTVEFPAAGIPAWRVQRRRLPAWRAAVIRLTIYYTAIAGSTNNFIVLIRTREHGAGTVHPAANIYAATLTIPGPAVANTELSYVHVSTATAINGALDGVTFVFARDKTNVNDTNANSLHVFRTMWEILPV